MSGGQIFLFSVAAVFIVAALILRGRNRRREQAEPKVIDCRNHYQILVTRSFNFDGEISYFYEAQFRPAFEHKWTHIDTCVSREVAEKVCRTHADMPPFNSWIYLGRLP